MPETSEYLKWMPSIGAGVLFAVIAICIIVVIVLAAEGKLCCADCGKEPFANSYSAEYSARRHMQHDQILEDGTFGTSNVMSEPYGARSKL